MTVVAKAETPFPKRERICVSHYPLPSEPPEPAQLADLMELNSPATRLGQKAMYIHIPFCDQICSFCPFNKQLQDADEIKRYQEHLYEEISAYASTPYIASCTFGSLAVGGGTPSCLNADQLGGMLRFCREQFHFADDAELSIEGNPSNFSLERLTAARQAGANRISFGVQSFNDHYASMLEIPQDSDTSRQAIQNGRKAGFENVGIDLIYNLPDQTEEQWRRDVEEAIAWKLDHITLFSLIIPPFTKLFVQIDKKQLTMPGGYEHEIRLYNLAVSLLREAGYVQYSVYDFALPGKVNKHAVLYFSEQQDLLGLGAAAFGYLGRYMYVNRGPLKEYYGSIEKHEYPVLIGSKADPMEEMCGAMAKGLRLFSVNRQRFVEQFACQPEDVFGDKICNLQERGLLVCDEHELRLSDEGVFWGNNICREFFSEKYAAIEAIPREVLARGRMQKSGNFRPDPRS